ncbi:hypothetical protein [Methanococcoides sp. FTZ1]
MTTPPRSVSRMMDVISLVGFMVIFLAQMLAVPLLILLVLAYLWRRYR